MFEAAPPVLLRALASRGQGRGPLSPGLVPPPRLRLRFPKNLQATSQQSGRPASSRPATSADASTLSPLLSEKIDRHGWLALEAPDWMEHPDCRGLQCAGAILHRGRYQVQVCRILPSAAVLPLPPAS